MSLHLAVFTFTYAQNNNSGESSVCVYLLSLLCSLIEGAVWKDGVLWPGVPLRSQTQMDKMRGKRRHS